MMISTAKQAEPNCGIYQNIPVDQYNNWPMLRRSAIDLVITKSMAHAKAYIDGDLGDYESKDLNFGSKYHMLLLEPERFREAYELVESCCAVTQSGKSKGERCGNSPRFRDVHGNWWCGQHKGQAGAACCESEFCVTPDELEKLEAMRSKVKANRVVNLLRQHGGCEVSIVWEYAGVKLKSRLDKFIHGGKIAPVIIDLKKTRSASRYKVEKSILEYGYHRQAAMYQDAVEHATGEKADPIYIFQEDTAPYELAVYQIDDMTLEIGRREYRSAVQAIKYAMETGEWPGYTSDITPIGLPEWYIKREGRFTE